MRPALLCSLLLACVPEDKPTSTSSASDAASTTAEVTTSGSTGGSTSSASSSDASSDASATASTSSSSDASATTSSPVACEGLDEAACLADPACTAHHGAPRVTQNGMVCADFKHPQFLACGAAGPPCPPVVLTVCPIGQPDVAFDVASGCIPPGYETCLDGPAPECP